MKENQPGDFKRELGLLDGTMLVVGSMIGSGIFMNELVSNVFLLMTQYSKSLIKEVINHRDRYRADHAI